MKKTVLAALLILLSTSAMADSLKDAEKEYQEAQAALAKAQEDFLKSQLKFDKARESEGSANLAPHAPKNPNAWTPQSWLKALKAMPKGNLSRGKTLSREAYCITCHGDKGIPQTDAAPALAGQVPAFVYKALLDYKSGLIHIDGKSLGMQAAARALSNQDMADLAAYYSAQKMPPRKRSGKKPSVPLIAGMCAGCHGTKGEGGANNSGPAVAILNSYYLNRQLKAFQQGRRQSEVNHMMQSMMSSLSDKQIEEIVAYLANM
ncbi:MAG: c-type cytochrome [bacterium]